MKYEFDIMKVGDFVWQMLETREAMILFNEHAPYEYKHMVVAHNQQDFAQDIVPGDHVKIAKFEYEVTAVGEDAMKNLRKEGHCTLVFQGLDKTELPGQIMLKGDGIPDFIEGDKIRIF